MKVYHFIKYNNNTCLDKLTVQTDSKTTLCFDFEDSIQDCFSETNTPTLKTAYRNHFRTIITNCESDIKKSNIGIRINTNDSSEYLSDLLLLTEIKNIKTIFLPKVSNSNQILDLQNDLQENGVSYQEIIPVIETKNGLNNLEDILKIDLNKIGGVAFGHCDYNLCNSNYPFFHQDSREYWTWITKLYESSKRYNLRIINSPFLQLDNIEYFKEVLNILYAIGGNNVGQITLTQKQTGICNSFLNDSENRVLPKISNRLDLRVPAFYAERFIESFKKNINNKGFAINNDRTILSPQEYTSSLNFQRRMELPEVNFTFVGGCFPVQGNLAFENLFHQLLKHKVEDIREIRFNVNIIRYERFKNCSYKIASYNKNQPIDILVFSIRPEPFLRLVKLYYKFLDNSNGKIKWSLNLPAFNKVNPEKFDLLSLDTRFNPAGVNDSSILRKIFINLNYILGSLLGNDKYSLNKYLELINEVIEFSKKNNIKLFILGTPIRINTIIERLLCKRLDRFMRKSLTVSQDNYVSGSDLVNNGERLFEKNGIYANEKYHELISERILEKILPTINQINAPTVPTQKTVKILFSAKKNPIFWNNTSIEDALTDIYSK
jgi:citrate lyase beta subunit